MRRQIVNAGVTVQAVAGNHEVFLGFDLDAPLRKGSLGFAIYREDQTENEAYWLAGFKTFKSVVPVVPDPKQMYVSRDHPIQSFYWGDYTTKPAHTYTYRVVPRYGDPKNLVDQPGVEASVTVTTNDPARGTHGIYFNRGVAASQAYIRKFADTPPSLPDDQKAVALQWLSRGLDEALLAFIAQGAKAGKALRLAAYEFTEPGVLGALKDAHDAGGDIAIIYHARADETGDHNRTALGLARLSPTILTPRRHAPIAHNKFIVSCDVARDGTLAPTAVWTGSTNMSQGGIFGHSNVGHAVRDPSVAQAYLDYWDELQSDPAGAVLRPWVDTNSPFAAKAMKSAGIHTAFSPRGQLTPLNWYSQQFAKKSGDPGFITLPFGMTTVIENDLTAYHGSALHFVLLNRRDDHQDQWGALPNVLLAVGAEAKAGELMRWSAEHLTGFNPKVPYLHTKIILVDPLSADPTVISGSANFSDASTNANDENMLIIRGDLEVADVYFTEFARIFQHFYARLWAEQITNDPNRPDGSFLVEDDAWKDRYYQRGNIKAKQRELFTAGVQGNV
jgi:phosphatidylserine/phosphatidylglycerophosphate/cardiolipin synthase-like enzyme